MYIWSPSDFISKMKTIYKLLRIFGYVFFHYRWGMIHFSSDFSAISSIPVLGLPLNLCASTGKKWTNPVASYASCKMSSLCCACKTDAYFNWTEWILVVIHTYLHYSSTNKMYNGSFLLFSVLRDKCRRNQLEIQFNLLEKIISSMSK